MCVCVWARARALHKPRLSTEPSRCARFYKHVCSITFFHNFKTPRYSYPVINVATLVSVTFVSPGAYTQS